MNSRVMGVLGLVLLWPVLNCGAPQTKIPAEGAPGIAGCRVFPDDNIWNTRIDQLPVHARSADWIQSIGPAGTIHEDFSSMPINYADASTPRYNVPASTTENDPGPYPIPNSVQQEPGSDGHLIVVEKDACVLYELFQAARTSTGWQSAGGAIFDLKSNALRTAGWTSADAAGLPILPGLVRYDEVASGTIRHALRFTAPSTQRAYLWPARHFASSNTDPRLPPMGARFRLHASFDETGFSANMLVIVRAMKNYGIILADNGGAWYMTGEPSTNWKTDEIVGDLRRIKGSDFEAVDTSSLMADSNSARVQRNLIPPPHPAK